MRKIKFISAILVVIGILTIIIVRPKEFKETRFMMDTVCEIKVIARFKPKSVINEAFKVMHQIDSLASFEGTGPLARINRGEEIEISHQVSYLIKEGKKIGKLTYGTFDITIRPLMEVWGDFKEPKIPEAEEITKALPLINYKSVDLKSNRVIFQKKGMKLDLSGIAKGYAVDLAVEKLESLGIKAGLVNAGGDIRVFGDRIWKIGIKNPRKSGIIKVLRLKNQAVATSGDYEKYFILNNIRYHHILSPHTGKPVRECASVTVISDNTMFADAIATGVFVLGHNKGIKLLDSLNIPGLLITPDLKLLQSKALISFLQKQ
ncbi:FAD:protein FMN transferase [candidate division WOR-3 bacterium]|nr:FAD:protein FMN transferase [candidate division WOR-3 bacterium]